VYACLLVCLLACLVTIFCAETEWIERAEASVQAYINTINQTKTSAEFSDELFDEYKQASESLELALVLAERERERTRERERGERERKERKVATEKAASERKVSVY